MSYNSANLTVSRRFDTPSGQHYGYEYSTSDTVATVKGGGYFATIDAFQKLRPGDLVAVTCFDGNFLGFVDGTGTPGSPDVTLVDIATVSAFNGW